MKKRRPWKHQVSAMNYCRQERHPALFMDMRLGKAQPLDAKILTPWGWKKMGEIKVGDKLINSFGYTSNVTGVFPRGIQSVYEVAFSRGAKTQCSLNHLWNVNTPVRRYRGYPSMVLSLKEIRSQLHDANKNRRYFIPMVSKIRFHKGNKRRIIDPYLLGILLGDGHLGKNGISFATADKEISDSVQKALPNSMIAKKLQDKYTWSIRRQQLKHGTRNIILDALTKFGLTGKRSENKFIPQHYLLAPIEIRISILQGLLDTDGFVSADGMILDYSSASKQLAEDVLFLVYSLGGTGSISVHKTKCLPSHRVSISVPPDISPFRLKRKRDRYRPKTKFFPSRSIESIRYIGKKEVQCISTDASDSLYVTDDFILTHNCLVAIRRIKMYKPLDANQGLRVLITAPNSALDDWQEDLSLEGEENMTFLSGSRDKRRDILSEGYKWNLLNKEGFLSVPEIGNREHCSRCNGRGKNPEDKTKRCGHCSGSGNILMDEPLVDWDAVVLDESTTIKNPKAKVTKFFLNNFRDCPHRWILTGMPNPESPLEFWPQLAFLDGRAFGHKNFWGFRAECFMQTPFGHGWDPQPGMSSMIHKAVGRKAFILHRKDVNMANEKIYEKRFFNLPKKLRKKYEKIEDSFILEDKGIEVKRATYAVQTYQWLRQLCGGHVDHKLVWNGKIKELINLLQGELANQSIVIWFNYNQEMFEVATRLKKVGIKYSIMHGSPMTQTRRRKEKKKFQNGQVLVILIQQAVAQMGANLSKADTAVYFSSPTGLLARTQTEARIEHGTKKQPLLYIDLLVRDSVDLDLYLALKNKKFKSKMTINRTKKYCAERRESRGQN